MVAVASGLVATQVWSCRQMSVWYLETAGSDMAEAEMWLNYMS